MEYLYVPGTLENMYTDIGIYDIYTMKQLEHTIRQHLIEC